MTTQQTQQQNMFSESCEDMPLFSGTPVRVSPVVVQHDDSEFAQMTLPGFAVETRPVFKGGNNG